MVRLSLKQWRMLREKPSLLQIDLGECLTWQGTSMVPVESVEGFGIHGYSEKALDVGPDLTAITEFFGLDEMRAGELRTSLQRYSVRLRELEEQSELPEYSGGGSMTLRFPGSDREKETAFAALREEMTAAIGTADADRLWVLSSISETWSARDIEVSASVTGEWARIKLSDSQEVMLSVQDAQRSGGDSMVTGSLGAWKRVSHLKHQIDWNRLMEEASAKSVPE
jgi:hypothetical protein